MMIGALLMSAAFLTMHFATSIWMFSLAFGLLGGVAVSCLGMTPVTALVGRWFPVNSGRALGVAFMPILVTLMPPLAGYTNVQFGWRTTALMAGLAALALLPLFRWVQEPPPGDAVHHPNSIHAAHGSAVVDRSFKPDRLFWLLTAAVGIFDGGAIALITHVIPYATEAGIDYQRATLLDAGGRGDPAGDRVVGVSARRAVFDADRRDGVAWFLRRRLRGARGHVAGGPLPWRTARTRRRARRSRCAAVQLRAAVTRRCASRPNRQLPLDVPVPDRAVWGRIRNAARGRAFRGLRTRA
jgi:hypothetical protein